MESVPSESYGPVVVVEDDGEIRVGYYDDDHWEYEGDPGEEESGEGDPDEEESDEDDRGRRLAIVYFCEPPFLFDARFEFVPPDRLVSVDTEALLRRRGRLSRLLVDAADVSSPTKRDLVESYRLLLEYSFVNRLLADRMFDALRHEGDPGGRRVFISHSSTDKRIAVALSVDLANLGHRPWLDEWEISAGESIPLKISEGLEQSDYVMVLMSRVAVESGWVEAEWTTKYWDEVGAREVRVIPVLLEDCRIPTLLKSRKYADLRSDYRDGLNEILRAIR